MTQTISSPSTWFWRGARDGLPFTLVVAPFALLFGVVATEAGLNLLETMAMTILVIAGAAQFTAIALMVDQAPTFIVILTALAVNLRMALYSASMSTHLGTLPVWKKAFVAYFLVDQSYAASILKYEQHPELHPQSKLAYFFGIMVPIGPLWYGFTLIGAVAGSAIPPEFALDFAVPITFIALIAPMLRTIPHVVTALVSITVALLLVWVPYSMGLIVAAIFAMAAGAGTEILMERRKGAA
ncbi:4-azaleucine resistance probable transporter AzlC [Monaibacterium marinum]|uniref:4-azaleucine resistance probable transporter AzlC n=1 Tax=Pontivivens marinum TaxID=1690039 RepID=A0A2C9CS62_9RHOB|nr:AzlC family ABC transporter permease [Monaibacterium marinum]SOH94082.1 4-azaleucine resistance probable transporter AzlC [Monaibacterium marinum]